MIMSEIYNGPNNATPLFRIYSDKGYYLQSGENRYIEAFISDKENIKNYYETIFPIPSPIANTAFVYQTFLGDYHDITQRDILAAKPIIKKAISNKLNNLYKSALFKLEIAFLIIGFAARISR